MARLSPNVTLSSESSIPDRGGTAGDVVSFDRHSLAKGGAVPTITAKLIVGANDRPSPAAEGRPSRLFSAKEIDTHNLTFQNQII